MRAFHLLLLTAILIAAQPTHGGIPIRNKSLLSLVHKINKQHSPEYTDELIKQINKLKPNITLAVEIDELVQAGNLQEIIWRLREEGFANKANKLDEYLSNTLATAEIISISDIGTGWNKPQLVEFANGVRGVYKTSSSSKRSREVALYRLDQLINTNVFPLTIERTFDGQSGSMQLFIENAASANEIRKLVNTEELDAYAATKEINTLRLLGHDWDRNANNYMFPIKGRAFAVDGENSFSGNKSNGSIWGNSVIRWQDLWDNFAATRGKGLEQLDLHAPAPQINTDTLGEAVNGYLVNPDFIARLEKITPEQVDAVIEPVIAAVAADNIELRKSLHKIIDLRKNKSNNTTVNAIKQEREKVKELFAKVYQHLDTEGIERKISAFNFNTGDNAVALGNLRQRIADYIAVIKRTAAEESSQP